MIFESREFNTLKECKKETKKLKNNIFEKFGVDKKHSRLARGNIILCGYSSNYKHWFMITDTITNFNRWIKSNGYSKFKLVTTDITIQK